MSASFCDGSGLRHSVSRSCQRTQINMILSLERPYPEPLLAGIDELAGRGGTFTSIVKSSSILTALPNMKIYCMRFENSHMLRSRSSRLSSVAGSEDSISSLPRFRVIILTRLLRLDILVAMLNYIERVQARARKNA
jgi:hypothetical protein